MQVILKISHRFGYRTDITGNLLVVCEHFLECVSRKIVSRHQIQKLTERKTTQII